MGQPAAPVGANGRRRWGPSTRPEQASVDANRGIDPNCPGDHLVAKCWATSFRVRVARRIGI